MYDKMWHKSGFYVTVLSMSETSDNLLVEIVDTVKQTGSYALDVLYPSNKIELFGTAGIIAGIATAIKDRKVLVPSLTVAVGFMYANHQAGSRTHLYDRQDSV